MFIKNIIRRLFLRLLDIKEADENTDNAPGMGPMISPMISPIISGPGADFAEFFESADGLPIEAGISVCLVKGQIKPAEKGDTPIGIIAANPLVLGGNYTQWPNKYLKDALGNPVTEEIEIEKMVQKTRKVKKERQKMIVKNIETETVDLVEKEVKGKVKLIEVKRTEKNKIEEPVFEERAEGEAMKIRVPVMETYEVDEPMWNENGEPIMVGTGKFTKTTQFKLNPDFDSQKEYVPRNKRPEWNKVGLLGQLPLKKGQPTAPGWVKIKSLSKDVDLWLIK